LGFGAILALLWSAVYYNISRDLITTASTAASGFATYASEIQGLSAAARRT